MNSNSHTHALARFPNLANVKVIVNFTINKMPLLRCSCRSDLLVATRQIMQHIIRGMPKDECAKSTVRMPFGIPRMAFAMIHTVDLAYAAKRIWR